MIRLIEPCKEYVDSYTQAVDEFLTAGVSTYSFSDPRKVDIFDKFDRYRHGRDIPQDHVAEDFFWLVDDTKKAFIGQITLRHELTDSLRLCGGHIGYAVRRSCWNQGYGTKMLGLVLEKAKELGLDRVLVTCNDDNLPSARVIEKNGFVQADKVMVGGGWKRRYWKDL